MTTFCQAAPHLQVAKGAWGKVIGFSQHVFLKKKQRGHQKSEMIGAPKWDGSNMKKKCFTFSGDILLWFVLYSASFVSRTLRTAELSVPILPKDIQISNKKVSFEVRYTTFFAINSLLLPWWWISGTMSLDTMLPLPRWPATRAWYDPLEHRRFLLPLDEYIKPLN